MAPNLKEEKFLWKKGFKNIAGLDEAGRGPLAGPVVAAAVSILDYGKFRLKNIDDSKKLSQKQREFLYEKITSDRNIKWGIGIVSEKIIDKINIFEASRLAMRKATKNLDCGFLLIDGNFKINSRILQKSIIKGDSKVVSIAAASIIAKVARDRLMQKAHKKYPQYGFARHKGYGTKLHMEMLAKFGACPMHRKSFVPVQRYSQV